MYFCDKIFLIWHCKAKFLSLSLPVTDVQYTLHFMSSVDWLDLCELNEN